MRCTRCGYISFKALKKCENCGSAVAKAAKGRSHRKPSLEEDRPFTIFPQGSAVVIPPVPLSPEPEAEDESYMTPPGQVVHPVFNSEGDFELDLSEALVEENFEKQEEAAASTANAFGLELSSQVYDGAEDLDEIDLGEIEVEGLGFEGLDAEYAVPEEESGKHKQEADSSIDFTQYQEEFSEKGSPASPSILDELDLDFDPDEDEEIPAKGMDGKKSR